MSHWAVADQAGMLEHKLIEKTICRSTPFQFGGSGVKGFTLNSTKKSHRWEAMVSSKRDGQPDAVSLTLGTLTSVSTEAGHKAVSLVAKPKNKV